MERTNDERRTRSSKGLARDHSTLRGGSVYSTCSGDGVADLTWLAAVQILQSHCSQQDKFRYALLFLGRLLHQIRINKATYLDCQYSCCCYCCCCSSHHPSPLRIIIKSNSCRFVCWIPPPCASTATSSIALRQSTSCLSASVDFVIWWMPQGVVWSFLDDALVYSVCVCVTRTSLGLFGDGDLHSTVSRDTNSLMLKTHFAGRRAVHVLQCSWSHHRWCMQRRRKEGRKERTNEPIAMRLKQQVYNGTNMYWCARSSTTATTTLSQPSTSRTLTSLPTGETIRNCVKDASLDWSLATLDQLFRYWLKWLHLLTHRISVKNERSREAFI